MPTTTFRSDLVAGIGTMMNAYIAANPTLLRRHYDENPTTSSTDTPYSYLDSLRSEPVTFDNSLRERIITAEIVVLQRWTDNAETSDRTDTLEDSLLSFISGSTYFHIVPNSWWSQMEVTPENQPGRPGFRIAIEVHYLDGSQ